MSMRSYIVIIVLSFIFNSVSAQETGLKDILDAKKSTITDTIFKIKTEFNDSIDVSIRLISGAENGKTFTIMAGIHGMEYPTILSLLEIQHEIDPKQLKGNLIIIPIVNTVPFFKRVPFVNPIDQLNLNRTFPGRPDGTITEVLADFITKEVFSTTDVLLDMHGGDVAEDLIPFMCFYDNKEFVEQTKLVSHLSDISGFETIVSYPYNLPKDKPSMYAFKEAVRQGIPALSIEIGKLGNWNKQEVDLSKDAIYRMMRELGMYNNQNVKPAGPAKTWYDRQAYISVPEQGIFYSNVKAGDHVKKGSELGFITDVFGNRRQTIISPASGIVLHKVSTPPVNKGETLFCIGYKATGTTE